MNFNEEKNDLTEIKERIYLEDRVEEILAELECLHINRIRNDRYEAQLPERFDSHNRRAVQVRLTPSLGSAIRNHDINGDIFAIISFILYGAKEWSEVLENLYQSKVFVCNLFGWDEYLSNLDTSFEEKQEKVDYLAFLRPIQKKRKQRARLDNVCHKENSILDARVLDRYFDYPHYAFYKDGILPDTQKFFGVMFDRESERVIYPVHNKNGDLIGVKGRYVGENREILDSVKYLYLHRCDKSIELWNLHRALEHIKEKKEVIVFESAKSCMLAWQWGYKNCVSLEGSELSPVQATMLKMLEADIIFALDKDMGMEHLHKMSRQIKSRICKTIFDKDDLLGEKQAPVDQGKRVWETLYCNYKKSVR